MLSFSVVQGQYYGVLGHRQTVSLTGAEAWNAKVGSEGFGQVSGGNLTDITTLYDALIAAEGTPGDIIAVYIHAQDGSEGAGFVNLMDPENYQCTETGNIVWTSDQGIETATSATNYYNTGINPTTAGMATGDAFLGVYSAPLVINENVYYLGTANAGGNLYLGHYRTVSKRIANISNNRLSNQAVNHSGTGWDSNHFFGMSITGTGTTQTDIYIDGTDISSPSFGASSLANDDIWIGAINNTFPTTPAHTGNIAVTIIAMGLTATEVADVSSAIDTYVATTSF